MPMGTTIVFVEGFFFSFFSRLSREITPNLSFLAKNQNAKKMQPILLTNNNTKGTKCKGFWPGPEKRWLKHANGHHHCICGLIIVSVHICNIAHLRKITVPGSSDRWLEKIFNLHHAGKLLMIGNIFEVGVHLK